MMNGPIGIKVLWPNLMFTVGIVIPAVLAYSLISARDKVDRERLVSAAAAATVTPNDTVK